MSLIFILQLYTVGLFPPGTTTPSGPPLASFQIQASTVTCGQPLEATVPGPFVPGSQPVMLQWADPTVTNRGCNTPDISAQLKAWPLQCTATPCPQYPFFMQTSSTNPWVQQQPVLAGTFSPPPPTTTITFDDLAPDTLLNGIYPPGIANWGTNRWLTSGPVGLFTTISIAFPTSSGRAALFSLLNNRTVVSVDAYNNASAPSGSSVSVSCASNTALKPVGVKLVPDQLVTLTTHWTLPCTSVKLYSSNGWWVNFDNVVVQ